MIDRLAGDIPTRSRAAVHGDLVMTVAVAPLKDVVARGVGRSLWMLFGAVSVLLLIACTNIATLLLARGAHREQEVAVRYSLGASRRAVTGQLLTEATLLAVAGAPPSRFCCQNMVVTQNW